MTHLPFIVASYVIAIGLPLGYAASAGQRLRRARRRLMALDPRAAREMAQQAKGTVS